MIHSISKEYDIYHFPLLRLRCELLFWNSIMHMTTRKVTVNFCLRYDRVVIILISYYWGSIRVLEIIPALIVPKCSSFVDM